MAPETSGPRFSVVIPAYNAAATLARAIDSVLAQTWPAHEIVVVDDGSADATGAVASGFGERVHYLRQANAGPSAARNQGVQAAAGDWIAFLDADDWFYPDRLRVHAEMIQAKPGLDFLLAGYDYRDAEGRLIQPSLPASALGRRLLHRHGEGGRALIEGADIGAYIAEQFSDTRGLSVPRERFIAVGGFPLGLRICEDVVFLLRLCAASRRAGVVCSSQAVYLVHEHGLIRSDRLRAQTETVRALRTLDDEMTAAPAHVREAWRRLVKEAYRDLAYHLAKRGEPAPALRTLLGSLRFRPNWRDAKDLLSVLRG